jgi:hypothetical protein
MPSNGPEREPSILVRVPSNVVTAATSDAMPERKPEDLEEKSPSETESNHPESDEEGQREPDVAAPPAFKEGGYGW